MDRVRLRLVRVILSPQAFATATSEKSGIGDHHSGKTVEKPRPALGRGVTIMSWSATFWFACVADTGWELPLRAVKAVSRSLWKGGYGADSGRMWHRIHAGSLPCDGCFDDARDFLAHVRARSSPLPSGLRCSRAMRRSTSAIYKARRLTSITAATADTSSWLIRAYLRGHHSFVTNLIGPSPAPRPRSPQAR
jgi:hypothetical protein